jgi:hypothetical protein
MPHQHARLRLLAAAGGIVLSATVALAQDVEINIGLGTPPLAPLVITTPPQLVVVPGTSVYYAPDVGANYFFYRGRYYTVANHIWSTARVYNGPWVVIQIGKVPSAVRSVPVEYYKVPPGHAKQHGQPPWGRQGHKSKKPKHH